EAEAGLYQDEVARVNAAAGANARRIASLTGAELPEAGKAMDPEEVKGPVVGGEIQKTRQELRKVQVEAAKTTGIKLGLILAGAFLLPRLLLWPVRRLIGSGE